MKFNNYFFIDSADSNYIASKYDLLSSHINSPHQFVGITTNPRIMQKAGVISLSSYFGAIQNIINFLYSIEGNNTYTIFIQPLDLTWNNEKIIQFINDHLDLLNNNSTKVRIGCKLGINYNVLNSLNLGMINHPLLFDGLNITGITTAQELLLYGLMGYHINYVSLLTGRMEEVGIDPYPQLNFASQFISNNIISGSLRTFKQLEKTIAAGAIPTLGNSILDQLNESTIEEFVGIMNTPQQQFNLIRPPVDNIEPHLNLSEQFFNQMNTIGQSIYNG